MEHTHADAQKYVIPRLIIIDFRLEFSFWRIPQLLIEVRHFARFTVFASLYA